MTRILQFTLAVFTTVLIVSACKPPKEETPTERFILLLGSPVPASLKDLRYERFGGRDPIYYVSFSVTAADMQMLIQRCQFAPATEMAPLLNSKHPKWWRPTELSEPRSFYKRELKRSTQFLWLDSTGTKACFEYFGY